MVCICGFDVLINDENQKGKGALVFYDTEQNKIIYSVTNVMMCVEPYQAGFLAKRELPFFIDLYKMIPYCPDVIFVDGNGRLHPEKNGLACQISKYINNSMPVIGISKNMYNFSGIIIENDKIIYDDEIVGYKVYNGLSKKPVYVSLGGGDITLEDAIKLVKNCSKYRISEPIKYADQLTRI